MTIQSGKFQSSCRRSLLFVTAGILLCVAPVSAEDQACRSKSGAVKAVYPEVAKRMRITGTVRLHLLLNNNGAVREVKVLGGNPVLASAAQDAVKQAKFEGDSCVINFEFKE